MNYRQLLIFVTVCNHNSMTQTAEILSMTQPAVSQSIRELEEVYKVKLFERVGRQLRLTEAGKMLHEYASHILEMYREIDRNMKEVEGVRSISVGANLSVGAGMLIDLIKQFQKKYPNIQVHAKITGSGKLVNMLEQYELDLGLMEDLGNRTQLVQIPFARDRTMVVVWPEHPLLQQKTVYVRDLVKETFLLREKGAGVRDRFDDMMHAGNVEIHPLWECSSTQVLVKAVQEKMGISVLPYQLVKEELEKGTIVECKVADLNLERNLNLVYHPKKVMNQPLRDFMEMIAGKKLEYGENVKDTV